LLEQPAVPFRAATSKENSRTIDLLWQLSEDRAQALGRGEPKIRRRQFSLIDNAKLAAGCLRSCHSFYKNAGGFRAAAFDSENAFTGFHRFLCLAVFAEN